MKVSAAAPISAWPSWAGGDVGVVHVVTTPTGTVASRKLPPSDLLASGAWCTPASGQVSASTPDRPDTTGPSSTTPAKAPILAWTEHGNDVPLTQPVTAGRVAVLHVRSGGLLTMVGVDPVTVETRWRHQASAGTFGSFNDIPTTVVGRRVLYPRPEPGSPSHGIVLMLADAATGRDPHVCSSWYSLHDRPRVCGHDACFTSFTLWPGAGTHVGEFVQDSLPGQVVSDRSGQRLRWRESTRPRGMNW